MSSRTAELFNQGLDFFTADLDRLEGPVGHTVAAPCWVTSNNARSGPSLVIEIPAP